MTKFDNSYDFTSVNSAELIRFQSNTYSTFTASPTSNPTATIGLSAEDNRRLLVSILSEALAVVEETTASGNRDHHPLVRNHGNEGSFSSGQDDDEQATTRSSRDTNNDAEGAPQ